MQGKQVNIPASRGKGMMLPLFYKQQEECGGSGPALRENESSCMNHHILFIYYIKIQLQFNM